MNGDNFLEKYEKFELLHGINQMLDDFRSFKIEFPSSISNKKLEINSDAFKIMVGILAYIASKEHRTVPMWVSNEKLSFDYPYYLSNRLDSADKVRLFITSPSVLANKNIFLDTESLVRM